MADEGAAITGDGDMAYEAVSSNRGGQMADNGNDQDERRSGKDRRRFPGSKSIYQWNFDPSGNWWKEKRSGEDRRLQYATRQAAS